ncbi:putative enzymatic polyprotein [Sesamum angolense]|uniref:Enzymatic polyprotein n=1 Tax=Sesamum angolense TaxID=2727404 RepID=A0AAE1T573_9LAMI|nr:putative enzymatic polyprotein [Sesamum angolense]
MDLQPSQNNYSEGDRLQTSESLSGFFSRMTVSNKIMERIMRQDSNLSPYDGFRIGGIGKVLNQIGLNQRKHHIIYKVSSGEFAIPMEFTGKLMFDIHPRIAYNLADQDFSKVLTIHQDFKRKDLMKETNRPYSITYRIAYPFPTHIIPIYSLGKSISGFPEFSRNLLRTEFSSRMSFSKDRIMSYKGKEKDLLKALTPQEIRQPVVGRYEGMLEITGHEILVAGIAGRENGSITLGLSFLENHKPWGRKGNGADILLGNNFIQTFARYMQDNQRNLLIFTTNCGSEIQVLRREKAFNRIMPINFRSKRDDFDAKLTHPKMQDKRKFGKVLLSFRQQGLIDSDSFYEESEEEIKNLKEALEELKTMHISEENKLSLENVKRLIQRNFSENPLAWWDKNKIEATLKVKEECKYDSPGFLVRNHGEIKRGKPRSGFYQIKMESKSKKFTAFSTPQGQYIWNEHIVEKIRNFPDILKDKKHLQSFLEVVNFAGIFIKDLAKYRKDFQPLLKETESAKWKWEEIHTQRVRELKQVCNNLPKLAIPQDEDELVVYTDANDYRWAAVLMKKTTTGEEPCRYTGGLFTEHQAQVWHINEKEFFAVWKAFKKWPLFLLAKEFTLKVDNTNVKAFLKNKLESKIEKARIIRSQAECQYYCYNIVVIKSHENVLADFLTRDGGI